MVTRHYFTAFEALTWAYALEMDRGARMDATREECMKSWRWDQAAVLVLRDSEGKDSEGNLTEDFRRITVLDFFAIDGPARVLMPHPIQYPGVVEPGGKQHSRDQDGGEEDGRRDTGPEDGVGSCWAYALTVLIRDWRSGPQRLRPCYEAPIEPRDIHEFHRNRV
jgi:hypothetical protein